jgi:hypothetical protein
LLVLVKKRVLQRLKLLAALANVLVLHKLLANAQVNAQVVHSKLRRALLLQRQWLLRQWLLPQ